MIPFLLLIAFLFLSTTTLFGLLWWTGFEKVTSSREAANRAEQEAKQTVDAINVQLKKCQQAYASIRTQAETKIRALAEAGKATATDLARVKQSEATAQQTIQSLNKALTRWQSAIDAEAEARTEGDRIIAEATATATAMRGEAERAVADAMKTADTLRSDAQHQIAAAQRQAQSLKSNADALLAAATERAAAMVGNAEAQAKVIAGEAYELKGKVTEMEKTLKAIRNQIDGYGNEYIIPAHSLLDDLAEEVGYKEAGQKLKEAREHTRNMVRTGQAASCDYAQESRRQTAVAFVVDAFNGKVDSALSRVKHDNSGKLSQEIWDAFTLVNNNGEAFRNACITQEYLESRLAELKWASIAHEIKRQEAEEQRRIKEQIREDAKAKREYERAIKAAAKEKEAMRMAEARVREQMEKSAAEERERYAQASAEERLELERQSAEQRAKYEEQLAEMRAKMQEIEDRGQRAMSMAQQTKKGNVYIISNIGSFGEHVYKIGLTRRLDPHERVKELGDSSVPFGFDVHALIEAEDAPALEHRLHKHFALHQVNKVNHRKEFFRCELARIREEVEVLGLTATWTMAGAAQEYRETLVIEQMIADDPLAKQRWIDRQLELEDSEDNSTDDLVGSTVGEDDEED
jgi:hypothetical protein